MGYLFIILMIVLVIIVFTNLSLSSPASRSDKGAAGERRLESALGSIKSHGIKGYSLSNVYVPRKNGSTSEIDLLYITSRGLFVIESKNFSGYIFGHENRRNWTCTLPSEYKGRINKYKFFNPIWQNKSHINALKNYCGDVVTYSIIAFSDNCELMDVTCDPNHVTICHYSQFKKEIKRLWNEATERYSAEEVEELYQKLDLLDKSPETMGKHLDYAKNGNKSGLCPACGQPLVIRTARKGPNAGNQFYGCSNYPKCNYTQNIPQEGGAFTEE